MVSESITAIVKMYLQAVNAQGLPVDAGIVFGSQAREQATRWSDIDLLVISSRFDQTRRREDVNLLWYVAAQVDSRIEPVAVGQRQLEEDDSNALVELARREGQWISLIDNSLKEVL